MPEHRYGIRRRNPVEAGVQPTDHRPRSGTPLLLPIQVVLKVVNDEKLRVASIVLARSFFSFVIMQRTPPFIPAKGTFSFVITRSDNDEVISALVLLYCPSYGNRGGLSSCEAAALALLARGDKGRE